MGVLVRPAMAADVRELLGIMGDEPSEEQIGISGNKRRARKVRSKLNEMMFAPDALSGTFVLVDDGDTIGLIKLGEEQGSGVSIGLVLTALHIFGLGIFGVMGRMKSRSRVDFVTPPDALHIAEVHVREDCRGKGCGEMLLRFAEEQAISQKCRRLSLTTTTANRARHLYERFGFTVAERKTDAEYERLTGIEGRILMVKDVGEGAS